jgi:hypothetical protein
VGTEHSNEAARRLFTRRSVARKSLSQGGT